ncbi:hypothetical protein OSI08_26530, partial [Mycobacterium ulcerans]
MFEEKGVSQEQMEFAGIGAVGWLLGIYRFKYSASDGQPRSRANADDSTQQNPVGEKCRSK